MLYKKMFSKIIIAAVICMATNGALIYAVDEENVEDSSVLKIADEQYTPKVTDAQYESIQKILEYINKEMKSIDEKIAMARTLPEYEKYPAVRLNIDTPYFGINSIVNSKLKIRDNVSTVDIANGYSIKSVVNRKVIKIESFEVSNVVVITRDLKIDKNMTSSDAQTCIFKLLTYLQQTKSVNKFLDKQLSPMITGYFSKEKNTTIYNINDQIKEIEEDLSDSLKELSYINAITENDITEDINTLYKYKEDISSLKAKVKSVLTDQTKLDSIYESILKTNQDIQLFRFNVNKKYLEVTNNIELEKSINLITLKMNNEINYLQNYIDKSKVETVDQTAVNTPVITDTNTTSVSESAAKTEQKQYTEVYKINSESIIQSMKKDIEKINVISAKIVSNNTIAGDNITNKEELDKNALIDEAMQIYIGFLNKENVFLTENVKVNITEIKKSKEININSFEDVIYIYISISDVLTSISDKFESSSVISNVRTSGNLKQVIDKVILISANFKKQEVTNVQ